MNLQVNKKSALPRLLLTLSFLCLNSCFLFSGSTQQVSLVKTPIEESQNSVTVKECGESNKNNALANTRELLIGLRNIKIIDQNDFVLKNKYLLRTIIQADLDEVPLNIITFSIPTNSCVTDIIFWNPNTENIDLSAIVPPERDPHLEYLVRTISKSNL